ncbi:uncharacterized protein LOC120116865 [Hibiscus syriacus]|uniref:uncharacterized protein LOC120116865 n=1 Tax=Hibiscus syriacus TaxID=106335 RepID=UPI0019220523|nr:uncharacterized protein LOC120116865 [Hibiscus syriacus]
MVIHGGMIRRWHFRFEASWLLENSCEDEEQRLWNEYTDCLSERLNFVSHGLDEWFKGICKKRSFTASVLKKKLEALVELQPIEEVLGEIIDTKLQLNLELDKSELYWEQRAKVNWLRFGDNNTAFFHHFTSNRRHKNKITTLKTDDGLIVNIEVGIRDVARDYFLTLFTSNVRQVDDRIMNDIATSITANMNTELLRPFYN